VAVRPAAARQDTLNQIVSAPLSWVQPVSGTNYQCDRRDTFSALSRCGKVFLLAPSSHITPLTYRIDLYCCDTWQFGLRGKVHDALQVERTVRRRTLNRVRSSNVAFTPYRRGGADTWISRGIDTRVDAENRFCRYHIPLMRTFQHAIQRVA